MRSPPAHYYVPPIWGAATHHLGRAGGTGRVLGPAALQAQQGLEAVSYTHLTLPTKA